MERIEPKKVLPLLNAEHMHRYVWAARNARGRVLDAACGVGYGAPLLLKSKNVTDYTGIDNSQEAVDYARRDYAGDRTSFIQGDIYTLPFADRTFDSVVSLETIEHLEQPGRALAELARVLKPEGVLFGSVPLADFETRCAEAYGPNEFHKSLFTLESLQTSLRELFPQVAIWNCWLSIASVLAPLNSDRANAALEEGTSWGTQLGSLLFAATRGPATVLPELGEVRVFPAVALVEHELKTLTPRDTAIRNQARMIDERDKVIRATEARLEARRIENLAQSKLVDDRDAAIKRQTEMIQARDAAITAQARLVDERNDLLAKQKGALSQLSADLDSAHHAQHATVAQLSGVQTELAIVAGQLSATRDELKLAAEKCGDLAKERDSLSGARDALAKELSAKAAELREHEVLVQAQSQLIEKRTAFIKHLESLIVARDAAIASQTRMIDERVALLAAQDVAIADRDRAIKSQTRMIDERDAAILGQHAMIAERDAVIAAQHASLMHLEATLAETRTFTGSLQLTVTAQGATISALEQRLASLGGSLSMVRQELRQHLADMQKPGYCFRQTTRAVLRLGQNGHADSEEGLT